MLEDIDRPRDPVRAPDRMRIELETYSWPLTRGCHLVATGLVFVPHGMQKLFDFWGGSLEWTAAEFARAGLEPAIFWSNYIGFLEFFGGILLAIGLLTRPGLMALSQVPATAGPANDLKAVEKGLRP